MVISLTIPQKYSLGGDINLIASKGSPLFRCRHHKIYFLLQNVNLFLA